MKHVAAAAAAQQHPKHRAAAAPAAEQPMKHVAAAAAAQKHQQHQAAAAAAAEQQIQQLVMDVYLDKHRAILRLDAEALCSGCLPGLHPLLAQACSVAALAGSCRYPMEWMALLRVLESVPGYIYGRT